MHYHRISEHHSEQPLFVKHLLQINRRDSGQRANDFNELGIFKSPLNPLMQMRCQPYSKAYILARMFSSRSPSP